MLYGGVNYRLKTDPENDVYVPWAGRVVFAPQKEGEEVKMQFYQVYLVRTSWAWLLGCVVVMLIDDLTGYRGSVGEEMRVLELKSRLDLAL